MTRIKICGLSEVQHALAAAEAGADFIGLVFASSPRQILAERASQIVEEILRLSPRPVIVGVFANSPACEVNCIADRCHLDWIQFSGDETWHYCQQIERPIIKTIHVLAGKSANELVHEIDTGYQLLHQKLTCLLDSKVGNVHGGTGQKFDWRLAKEISERFPLIVAGGLTPENVEQLVREVQPWGVDVSSGVESNGQKDAAKIRAFIQAVRTAHR